MRVLVSTGPVTTDSAKHDARLPAPSRRLNLFGCTIGHIDIPLQCYFTDARAHSDLIFSAAHDVAHGR